MFIRRLLILPVLALSLAMARPAQAAEEAIENFASSITINEDGSINVTERIEYNFADNDRHGIFRDIPLTAVDGPDIGITVNSVKNEIGQPYHYVESLDSGVLDLKIGEGDVIVSGIKTYVIDYTVINVIRPFEAHDELYWNVTGNGWPVAIKNSSAVISLPNKTEAIGTDCYVGATGWTGNNCDATVMPGEVRVITTQVLEAGQGMTVAIAIPPGIVDNSVEATPTGATWNGASEPEIIISPVIWGIFGAIVLAGLAVYAYLMKLVLGIFPKKRPQGAIITAYKPPDDLAPIDLGTILDQSVDTKDISSVIIDLAVRGYLKIRYTVQEIKFWPDKKDFELIKLKDGTDLVHPAEKVLFKLFFTNRESVTLSELLQNKTVFQSDLKQIKDSTLAYMLTLGYFDQANKERAEKLSKKFGLAMIVVFAMVFLLSIGSGGVGIIFMLPVFLLVGLATFGITKLTHSLSDKGWDARDQILGFKEFLQLTEKDKLELLNAPKLQPETFEKYLPYAMVLGVESQWAQKFEGIYQATPTWYDDPNNHVFSSTVMMANLRMFDNSFTNTVVASAPKSSSSGFSGGSSGGGSGGGGGGSW